MRIQRNTVYCVTVVAVLACIIAGYFSFYFPYDNRIAVFLSNIFLGIFASSVLAIIMSLVAYLGEKRDALENYYQSYLRIRNHTCEYPEYGSNADKVDWLDTYIDLNNDLSLQWSKIYFLFDRNKNRLFLEEVCDFYNTFVVQIGNDLRIFKDTYESECPLGIAEIENIIFVREVRSYRNNDSNENISITCKGNRLSGFIQEVDQNVYNVYAGNPKKKKYKVSDPSKQKYQVKITTLRNEDFTPVSPNLEKCILTILSVMNTDVKKICVKGMTQKEADQLKTAGLLYNSDLEDLKITPTLTHYFEFKDKSQYADNMNPSYIKMVK